MEEMLKKHSLLPGLQPQTRQKICPEELMVYPRKAETENNLKDSQAKLKGTSDKCYCFLSACCIPGTQSCLLYALTRNLSVAREAELFLSPFHRLQKLRPRELEVAAVGPEVGSVQLETLNSSWDSTLFWEWGQGVDGRFYYPPTQI